MLIKVEHSNLKYLCVLKNLCRCIIVNTSVLRFGYYLFSVGIQLKQEIVINAMQKLEASQKQLGKTTY